MSNPASKITTSVLQRDGKKSTNMSGHYNYNSIGTAEKNSKNDDKFTENSNQLMTSQQSSGTTQKQNQQTSIESTNNNMIFTQTNLQGSGNLNSSFKKVSQSSGKHGSKSQSGRQAAIGADKVVSSSSIKKANSSKKQS